MEQVHPGGVVQGKEEVEAEVDHEWEGWAAPEQAQVLGENVCVQNAEQRLLMRPVYPVTL
jgi:hypothetical protein